jgi:CubicO group peptidase (beta-lactamase class C family)
VCSALLVVSLNWASAAAQAIEQLGPPSQTLGTDYQPAAEATRVLMEKRVAEGLPGFSVAVSVAGQGQWADALGWADIEAERPATVLTRFRIGSTSKPVTAAIAGRLLDAGKVDFDRPLAEYFEPWRGRNVELTLAHLLSNQGGVRHYQGMESLSRQHYQNLTEGLEIFLSDPLRFEPGSDFSYSSYGFNLAGVVLEQVGGAEYLELAQREVFAPLGMEATGPDDVTLEIPQRATFYMRRSEGVVEAPKVDDSYKWPSGGLLSTPSDMVRFGSAFLGPGFLSAATLELVTTARSVPKGPTGYALGWRVHEPSEGFPRRALHHGGSSVGGRSMLVVVPDSGVVVSILCNSQDYRDKEDDAFAIAGWFSEPDAAGASQD